MKILMINILLLCLLSYCYSMCKFLTKEKIRYSNNNDIPLDLNNEKYDIIKLQKDIVTKNEINNMIILQNEFFKSIRNPGPGETSYIPININTKGRIELAVSVISTAIFILNLSIKLQESFNWNTSKELIVENGKNIYSDNIKQLDNGIKYINQIYNNNNNNNNNNNLSTGDKIQIIIKLFFNGLEINIKNDYNNIFYIEKYMIINNNMIDFDKLEINLPFQCLKNVIKNIPIGSITKISIPSDLAFGNIGFSPFVPPDATILCEISLFKL